MSSSINNVGMYKVPLTRCTRSALAVCRWSSHRGPFRLLIRWILQRTIGSVTAIPQTVEFEPQARHWRLHIALPPSWSVASHRFQQSVPLACLSYRLAILFGMVHRYFTVPDRLVPHTTDWIKQLFHLQSVQTQKFTCHCSRLPILQQLVVMEDSLNCSLTENAIALADCLDAFAMAVGLSDEIVN